MKKIRVLTNSDVKNAKFILRLYRANENGKPSEYLYDKNIIGIAKKGKHLTEINISDLHFQFPKNGFFIAIEWLLIPSNKHEYKYTMQGSKKKYNGISYEPSLGVIPTETAENTWEIDGGKWIKLSHKLENDFSKRYNGKYNLLAIELTLTD